MGFFGNIKNNLRQKGIKSGSAAPKPMGRSSNYIPQTKTGMPFEGMPPRMMAGGPVPPQNMPGGQNPGQMMPQRMMQQNGQSEKGLGGMFQNFNNMRQNPRPKFEGGGPLDLNRIIAGEAGMGQGRAISNQDRDILGELGRSRSNADVQNRLPEERIFSIEAEINNLIESFQVASRDNDQQSANQIKMQIEGLQNQIISIKSQAGDQQMSRDMMGESGRTLSNRDMSGRTISDIDRVNLNMGGESYYGMGGVAEYNMGGPLDLSQVLAELEKKN